MKNFFYCISLIFTLATSIVLGNEEFKSPFSEKKSSLDEISKIFTKLDSVIPKLTPSEEKWVNEEMLAIKNGQSEGARLTSYMQSREKAIYVLRKKINEVTKSVQSIKILQKQGNKAREAVAWTFLVQALQDDIEYETELLASKGIIAKNDLNTNVGFNWLKGENTADVQIFWGMWARVMWDSFVSLDLVIQLDHE